jgi:SNF family Na+-dependent transporter
MSLFYIYILFALTTSLTALYEILMPVIKRRLSEVDKVDNILTTSITFFVLSTLIAPLLFLSCVVPSMGVRFRNALYDGLYPKE